jgi:hypothetical protein
LKEEGDELKGWKKQEMEGSRYKKARIPESL